MTDLLAPIATLAGTWHDGGPGWWIVFVPLFWIALIATAVVLLRRARPWPEARQESALDVLDRRFAEGAVTEEEYRARRAVLTEKE